MEILSAHSVMPTRSRPGSASPSCRAQVGLCHDAHGFQLDNCCFLGFQVDTGSAASPPKKWLTAHGASDHNPYQGVLQTTALHAAHDMTYRSCTKKGSPTNDALAPELTAQQQSWPLLPRAAALSPSRLSLNHVPDQPRQNPPPREGHGPED